MRNRRSGKDSSVRSVSASELAQMGVCERLVVFEMRYGKRRSVAQRKALLRGQSFHRGFFCDGRMGASTDALLAMNFRWLGQAMRAAWRLISRCIALLRKGWRGGDRF